MNTKEERRKSIISELNRNSEDIKKERKEFSNEIYNGFLVLIGIFTVVSLDIIISSSIKFIPSILDTAENILDKNTISLLWMPLVFLWLVVYIFIVRIIIVFGIEFWIDKYILKEYPLDGELNNKLLNVFFTLLIIIINFSGWVFE
jgi:hypothetical protein